jgi:hypothetical protein
MLGHLIIYHMLGVQLPDMHAICDSVLDSCFIARRISNDVLPIVICEHTFHFSRKSKESISEDCSGLTLPCKLGKKRRLMIFYEARI